MSFIQCNNVVKSYSQGGSTVTAIDVTDLSIESGEFVAIMGESGAGKSTLLSVMGAMNTPSTGRFLVDGIDVYSLSSEQRADFRREYLGFIFQSFHLVPYLTVMENVMLPLTTAKISKRDKRDMALEAMTWVGVETKADRLPNQISGGEMERAAIARAIVNDPPILLADEPTGNLDSKNSEAVIALLRRLNQSGTTVIMVTHSSVCAQNAKRCLIVKDGRLCSDAKMAKPNAFSVQAA